MLNDVKLYAAWYYISRDGLAYFFAASVLGKRMSWRWHVVGGGRRHDRTFAVSGRLPASLEQRPEVGLTEGVAKLLAPQHVELVSRLCYFFVSH
jgi:hypothetical protein